MGENNVTKKEAVSAIEFLWLGLYAFAGFSLELILGLVVNLFGFDALSKGLNSGLTGILWFLAAYFLYWYAKRKFNFDIFRVKEKLNIKNLLICIIFIVFIVIATYIGFDGFKPLVEYNNGSEKNMMLYLLQVFYYLGESALIVLCIAFGQQFLEKQFSLKSLIPGGGIFLAITWGTMHFFLQGPGGGLFTIFFSMIAGGIYAACKKDIRWSYLLIAIAFIL